MKQMNVVMAGTTDDPIDSLEHHSNRSDNSFDVKVLPSWRPDKSVQIELDEAADYLQKIRHGCWRWDHSLHHLLAWGATLDSRLTFQRPWLPCSRPRWPGSGSLRTYSIRIGFGCPVSSAPQWRNTHRSRICAQFSSSGSSVVRQALRRNGLGNATYIGAQRNNNTRMFQLTRKRRCGVWFD